MKRWMSNVLIAVFAAVFLLCAYFLADYFMDSRQRQNEFASLADLVEQVQQEQEQTKTTDPAETETAPADSGLVQVTNPETGETVDVLKEYAQLYLMNNHLVGWMELEGTKLNYPVMQTPDSTDYYLHKGFDRSYSAHGCLYAREECDVGAPSDNITVYGHNMKDGSMFAPLFKYENKRFWEQNPYITFDSLTEHRTYQVMAVFYTTASEGEGFAYHLFEDAADEAEFYDFVDTCKELAIYDTGVTASYGDKLITLSTCEYSRTNGRFVVVAKRVNV